MKELFQLLTHLFKVSHYVFVKIDYGSISVITGLAF